MVNTGGWVGGWVGLRCLPVKYQLWFLGVTCPVNNRMLVSRPLAPVQQTAQALPCYLPSHQAVTLRTSVVLFLIALSDPSSFPVGVKGPYIPTWQVSSQSV